MKRTHEDIVPKVDTLELNVQPYSAEQKQNIETQVLDPDWKWNGKGLDNVPGLVKWMLGKNKQDGRPIETDETKEAVVAMIRGIIGERVSGTLGIAQAQTIYSSVRSPLPADLRTVEMGNMPGGPNKDWILRKALEKSLQSSPIKDPSLFFIDEKTGKPNARMSQKDILLGMRDIENEIILGYTVKGTDKDSGLTYRESVIPDGVLQYQDKLVGFIEVKAYTQDEFVQMLKTAKHNNRHETETTVDVIGKTGKTRKMKLGANFDAEIAFVDSLNAWNMGQVEEGRNQLMVVRVPQDISDTTLTEYGEYLVECGYQNVIIQKLPFTSTEINTMAVSALKSQIETIRAGKSGMQYSKKEIAMIEDLINQQESVSSIA